MKNFLPLVAVLMLLSGCGGITGSDTDESFNDCMLSNIPKAQNSEAVEELRSTCIRKYTSDRELKLEIVNAENIYKFDVTNPHKDIIVSFTVNAGEVGSWDFSSWIEPGTWESFEVPGDREKFRVAVEQGKVIVRSTRVINPNWKK